MTGLSCSMLVLFGGAVVHSSSPARLADSEQVIVRSSQPVDEGRRIGQTEYYVVSAAQARTERANSPESSTYAVQPYRTTVTNDPLEPQDYLTLLQAADVWDMTTGSSDTTVAVVDSGFALEHEDLTGRWFTNPAESGMTEAGDVCWDELAGPEDKATNECDDSENGLVDDWRGWDFANDGNDVSAGKTNTTGSAVNHGTSVSGMVGATGDNATGVASVNWQTTLLPIQVFDDDGVATTIELAEGIAHAIEMEADVINLSLGTTAADPVTEDLLQDAYDANIMVVAAAGNCGGSNYELNGCDFEGQMLYPATSELTLSVAGTDMSDERASFSSEGAMVDLSAPASGSIRTTLYDPADELGTYSGSIAGTSFATPIVSGTVAALKSLWPEASNRELRALLVDSALRIEEMDGAPFTEQHGFGRLRPARAASQSLLCQDAGLQADITCDGAVDLLDLSILASQWQIERTGRADMNDEGITDLLDLSILASEWGQTE